MIASTELSKYRSRLRKLIESIDKLAFACAHSDPLIQGTPGKVFRKCGQKNCKCAKDAAFRHGPYLVIQVYQDKKQRQLSIKKSQKEIWQKAKNYQKQIKLLAELKKKNIELSDLVHEIIKNRLEGYPT